MAGAPGRSRDEVAAYLALAQVPGIGAARLRTLVAAFESAAAALRAPHGAIAALPGFSRAAATAIRAGSPRGATRSSTSWIVSVPAFCFPTTPRFHRC